MCTELTCNFQSSVEQFYVMVFLLLLWKTPMAFSDTPSAPPVWCNYSEKPRCVRIELDYSNGTQCFYKPPYSWIIIIIICMCLAKSLIGKFQNETTLYKKKTFQSFSWRKKKIKVLLNTCIKLNHQIMQKVLWWKQLFPAYLS